MWHIIVDLLTKSPTPILLLRNCRWGGGWPQRKVSHICLPPFPRSRVPAVNLLPLSSKYSLHSPAWGTGLLLPRQLVGCLAVSGRALKAGTEKTGEEGRACPCFQGCSCLALGLHHEAVRAMGSPQPDSTLQVPSRRVPGAAPPHGQPVLQRALPITPRSRADFHAPWQDISSSVAHPNSLRAAALRFSLEQHLRGLLQGGSTSAQAGCPFCVLCLGALGSDFPLCASFVF